MSPYKLAVKYIIIIFTKTIALDKQFFMESWKIISAFFTSEYPLIINSEEFNSILKWIDRSYNDYSCIIKEIKSEVDILLVEKFDELYSLEFGKHISLLSLFLVESPNYFSQFITLLSVAIQNISSLKSFSLFYNILNVLLHQCDQFFFALEIPEYLLKQALKFCKNNLTELKSGILFFMLKIY